MIRWFLSGWVRLEVPDCERAALLDLCMRYGLCYAGWHIDPKSGNPRLETTACTATKLCRLAAEEGLSVRVIRQGGLPHLLKKYRYRIGLLLGLLLGFALYAASSCVLWDIRIQGNEHMSISQVREELRLGGLYVGMPLAELDSDHMETEIALVSDRLSWVAINLSGTVAYVEIRERVETPDMGPLQPANLVARCEGVVEEMEIYTGNRVTEPGQAVQAGDLLVSGVYDSQAVGWRVTRAAGRVLARTVHDISIEIPLIYEEKVYSQAPITQKTIIFFEKEIKLFKNSGILGMTCDKIDTVHHITLGQGGILPVSVRTTRHLPYVYRTATRDFAQAEELAYDELAAQLAQTLPDATLLRKQITVTLTEECYRLECRVWCLEDIAQTVEFSVEELP